MTPRRKIPAKRQQGQSLVELAISLTVLLLLLSGAVTFGMALFSYVAMRDAAQEGALYGSIEPCVRQPDNSCLITGPINQNAIVARVRSSSTSPIDFSNTTIIPDSYITVGTTGYPCEGNDPTTGVPNAIRVSIQYDYPIFMPFVGAIVGEQTIHLTATVTDTILTPSCPAAP